MIAIGEEIVQDQGQGPDQGMTSISAGKFESTLAQSHTTELRDHMLIWPKIVLLLFFLRRTTGFLVEFPRIIPRGSRNYKLNFPTVNIQVKGFKRSLNEK
jgi:hypothetical protein